LLPGYLKKGNYFEEKSEIDVSISVMTTKKKRRSWLTFSELFSVSYSSILGHPGADPVIEAGEIFHIMPVL